MRPLKLSTIRMLAVAGIGEATVHGIFGTSVATGLMAANVSWMAAVPAAIVAWNVGQLAVGQAMNAGTNALGYGVGKGLVKINDGANSVIGSGLRAVRMLIGGASNTPGANPVQGGPLVTAANPELLTDAINRAAAGSRPVMVDLLFTENGYKAFMESAKATRIPVVELDSLDEAKAGRARRAYTDVAQPIAEIMKLTEKAPLTTDDVARIVERTALSDIPPEHKEALYKTLDAELIEERAGLEIAKATRLTNAEKADQAALELDNASLTRLRDNAAFVEAFEAFGFVAEPDRFFQALQRSVAQEGAEATLAKLAQDPTQFAEERAVSPPGTTEPAGWLGRARPPVTPPPPAREGQQIALEPEVMRGLHMYVENVGAVKDNAAAVVALRARQMELEAALAERAAALEIVENQIRRETALLDPQTQRQILRDSLQTILDSKKTAEPELVRAGMTTAHAEEREADVAVGHEIQDAASAIAHGETPAGATALSQSEVVIRGFESLSTQAVARFYEAHPEKDPVANQQRQPDPADDVSKLGDVMIVEGFPPPEDAAPGRSIRTRTRRPKAQQAGMEM